MTHTTRYETRDGKTRRVKEAPPATAETAETTGKTAAPEASGADHNQSPAQPAKKGA
jgi:hypothetical protein